MAGSVAFLGGGFSLLPRCGLWYLQSCAVMPKLPKAALLYISMQAAALGAAVESLPIPEIDNLTVPITGGTDIKMDACTVGASAVMISGQP